MRKPYESSKPKVVGSCKEAIQAGGEKISFFSEQRGLGWISAEPTEEAHKKSDKHMGHIDTATTAREGSL